MKRLRTLFILILFSILFFPNLLVLTPVNAQTFWADPVVGELIENYYKEVSKEESLGSINFTYDYEYTQAHSSEQYIFEDNESYISFTLSGGTDLDTVSEEDLKEIGYAPLDYSGVTVYFNPNINTPYISDDKTFSTYSSKTVVYCGASYLNVSVDVYLRNSDVDKTNFQLADRLSTELLGKSVKNSKSCIDINRDSIFNENIEIEITQVYGEVEIKRASDVDYHTAIIGEKLKAGDYIATGFDSEATFKVSNIAELTIYEMTNFSVSQLNYDDNLASTAINLLKGRVSSNVKPEKGIKASFQIITPTVTVGVRGTQFEVSYNLEDSSTGISVYEGSVTAISTLTGETKEIGENESAYVSSNGEFETPNFDDLNPSTSNSLLSILIFCFCCCLPLAILALVVIFTLLRKRR